MPLLAPSLSARSCVESPSLHLEPTARGCPASAPSQPSTFSHPAYLGRFRCITTHTSFPDLHLSSPFPEHLRRANNSVPSRSIYPLVQGGTTSRSIRSCRSINLEERCKASRPLNRSRTQGTTYVWPATALSGEISTSTARESPTTRCFPSRPTSSGAKTAVASVPTAY